MTTVSADVLADILADYPEAWTRVAAFRPAGVANWQLRLAEIVIGNPPPQWAEISWLYPLARFQATVCPGRLVAEALRSGMFSVADEPCEVVSLPESVLQERRASWSEYGGSQPLDWPSDEWRLAIVGNSLHSGPEPLITDRAPPFQTADVALANLFGLTHRQNWSPPAREVVVRRVDETARIEGVDVDPTYVAVNLSGERLAGTTLSLGADTPGEQRRIDEIAPETLRFETPDGTPAGAWVTLARGERLLDERHIDRQRIRSPEPGVRYTEPPSTQEPDSYYTEEEQAEIRQAIERIKAVLPARFPELTPAQLGEFEDELDSAVEELPALKRGRWNRLMLGTVVRAIVKDLLTREAGEVVLMLLKLGLRALPASHGLPELHL